MDRRVLAIWKEFPIVERHGTSWNTHCTKKKKKTALRPPSIIFFVMHSSFGFDLAASRESVSLVFADGGPTY